MRRTGWRLGWAGLAKVSPNATARVQVVRDRVTEIDRLTGPVDRAVRELADTGLVRIEHRRAGRRNLTNRYHLTTQDPGGPPVRAAARSTRSRPCRYPVLRPAR